MNNLLPLLDRFAALAPDRQALVVAALLLALSLLLSALPSARAWRHWRARRSWRASVTRGGLRV
jgi:hypothetical protein